MRIKKRRSMPVDRRVFVTDLDVAGPKIIDANETPLTTLGFDALQQPHETLTDYYDCCWRGARDRQEFLQKTTNNGVDAGVRHRSSNRICLMIPRSTIRSWRRSPRSMKRVRSANEPCETI
ncbi:hypothetical protein ACFQFH_01300 [Halobaculum halobium]|uniref:DUF7260 domain-containing protein n=1 Tax=Halobaculum halobium TaxID=3032281 RepID=A0ABD5T560_9EURY|nr:hypothetical protein [Halobaculum sp. SYNS20]